MNLNKNCKNCFWYDSCAQGGNSNSNSDNPCDYTPLDDIELLETEYQEGLHMRVEEYQRYVDEMNGNA